MRIAIVSDIHGNLLALEAVIADLEAHGADEVWCGGDLGWGGPWAAECIERVRAAAWPTVRGNTDVWIAGEAQTPHVADDRRQEHKAQVEAMAAAHAIDPELARWLVSLPLGHAGDGSILLVHGTPETPFAAPEPDAQPAAFAPYQGRARLVVYGHVHKAFVRRLGDGTIVCNPGSVGLPKDGLDASYLIADQHGAEWTLRHRRVAFDRRAGLAEARRIGGPVGHTFTAALGPS